MSISMDEKLVERGHRTWISIGITLSLFWSLVIFGSYRWNNWQLDRAVIDQAKQQAEAALQGQGVVRRFVSRMGGIYVPSNESGNGVEPSPFLSHIQYRDIKRPDGKPLTLVNSSYLVRLLNEGQKKGDISVRATALLPLKQENAPDPWEIAALNKIHTGEKEWSELVKSDGELYWRQLKPRFATKECLICHHDPTIQVGQVLGGLSVKVPISSLNATASQRRDGVMFGHLSLWLIGLIGIGWMSVRGHAWARSHQEVQGRLSDDVRYQRALAKILRISLSTDDLSERLHNILRLTVDSPVADLMSKGAIFIRDTEGVLTMEAQINLSPAIQKSCAQLQKGQCLCGRAAELREVVFTDCVDELHTINYQGMQPHGHYCVPIQSQDELVGVFTLYISHGQLFDSTAERFLKSVADVLYDMIERNEALEGLEQKAFYDGLTGLPNRRLFMNRLNHHIESRKRGEITSAVMFLDLDRFKHINDAMGHNIGDQLLQEVATRISACLRPGDTVARLGGDEFTVLLETLDDYSTASSIAQRIHLEFQKPFVFGERKFISSASIGIAFTDVVGESSDDILRDADTAMYLAKEKGKGRTVIFDAKMHQNAQYTMELEQSLRLAVKEGMIKGWLQPIMDLQSGGVAGFELLARWRSVDGKFVSPEEFIPLAEEIGLIWDLDRQMIDQACAVIRDWEDKGILPDDFFIGINLSGRYIIKRSFLDALTETVEKYAISPSRLRLEVTEGLLLKDMDASETMVKTLRSLGFKVALDDFGTGYSSLHYLHNLSAQTLKIDKTFVSGFLEDRHQEALVMTIVDIARIFSMDIVAEGIETEAQAKRLMEIGCYMGQGYLYSPAMEVEKACGYFKEHQSEYSG